MSARRRLREPCQALLLDLDGVLRRFDPAHAGRVAADHDLPATLLTDLAFAPERLAGVVRGQVSHATWLAGIVDALADAITDRPRAERAVAAWHAHRGAVVPEVLAAVRQMRAAGIPVALGSNATDLLTADLTALDLTDEVDLVVNSSEIGYAKPAPEFYAAACDRLGVAPRHCLLVDDTDRNVRGARAAGLAAVRFTGPADLRYLPELLVAPAA